MLPTPQRNVKAETTTASEGAREWVEEFVELHNDSVGRSRAPYEKFDLNQTKSLQGDQEFSSESELQKYLMQYLANNSSFEWRCEQPMWDIIGDAIFRAFSIRKESRCDLVAYCRQNEKGQDDEVINALPEFVLELKNSTRDGYTVLDGENQAIVYAATVLHVARNSGYNIKEMNLGAFGFIDSKTRRLNYIQGNLHIAPMGEKLSYTRKVWCEGKRALTYLKNLPPSAKIPNDGKSRKLFTIPSDESITMEHPYKYIFALKNGMRYKWVTGPRRLVEGDRVWRNVRLVSDALGKEYENVVGQVVWEELFNSGEPLCFHKTKQLPNCIDLYHFFDGVEPDKRHRKLLELFRSKCSDSGESRLLSAIHHAIYKPLSILWEKSIMHGDIRLPNIMLDEGSCNLYLVDWTNTDKKVVQKTSDVLECFQALLGQSFGANLPDEKYRAKDADWYQHKAWWGALFTVLKQHLAAYIMVEKRKSVESSKDSREPASSRRSSKSSAFDNE